MCEIGTQPVGWVVSKGLLGEATIDMLKDHNMVTQLWTFDSEQVLQQFLVTSLNRI